MITLVKPSRGHVTQVYGNTQPDGNPHAGQDYAYTNGVEIYPEVYAAGDGVVLFAGDARGLAWPNIMYLNPDFNRSDNVDESAGNYTIIAHPDAAGNRVALTGYGHQEEIWVKAGDRVKAGQRIGTVGATGFSAGKHLHFDLVLFPFDVDDAPYYGRVDPNPYFAGSLSYQGGTITQLEEDEMSAEDIKYLKDKAHRAEQLLLSFQAVLTDPVSGYIGKAAMMILSGGNTSLFLKGKGNATIYAYNIETGELRGLVYDEWVVASDAGAKAVDVDQEKIDGLLALAAAKEGK